MYDFDLSFPLEVCFTTTTESILSPDVFYVGCLDRITLSSLKKLSWLKTVKVYENFNDPATISTSLGILHVGTLLLFSYRVHISQLSRGGERRDTHTVQITYLVCSTQTREDKTHRKGKSPCLTLPWPLSVCNLPVSKTGPPCSG